jgi:hydroxymethylglutaryl-CoA reductase
LFILFLFFLIFFYFICLFFFNYFFGVVVMEEFSGFYKKSVAERQEIISKFANLTPVEMNLLTKESSLPFSTADRMIENVVSTFPMPYGLALNFVVDGNEKIIPFALEEPSVVAAASNAAKLSTGFKTTISSPIMIGQIQLISLKNPEQAKEKILGAKKELLELAASKDPTLVKFGGGPVDVKAFVLETHRGKMIEVQLLVNVKDAMGANAVNTMCEAITSKLEEISEGKALLRILSNLAIYRTAKATTTWTQKSLEESTNGLMKGSEVVERILNAYAFACATPFRAATHNKGIMNGIDAVALATGNDFRALEAGMHTFASYNKPYTSVTKYYTNEVGDLVGEIELPLAVGIVGGATKTHPMAQLSLKIMKVTNATELASVIASVGLAQNFAALRALSTTGIQAGHMKLHAKNIAVQAGAKENEIDFVVQKMIEKKQVAQHIAEEAIKEFREKQN